MKTAINKNKVNIVTDQTPIRTVTAGYSINLSNLYAYSPEFITNMLKRVGYSSLKNVKQNTARN
ncbi:hypothetical protein D3C79_993470 [compost metagenome]